MATPSGTARTQLALWGGMTRRYGSFAGKAGPPAGTTVLAGCAVLSLTPQAPTFAFGGITVEASCAVLDLTPQAPAIEREPFIVLAGCAQLDLTPQAPAFDQDSVYTAGCAELVLTPNAPSIIVTTQVVAAGCAELILTPQAPTIIASGDVRVLAGCAELVLTPQSPSNSLGESSSFVPSPAVTFFDATSGPEPLPMTPGLALLVPDLEPLAAGPPPFAPDFVRRAQLRWKSVV